MKTLFLNSKLKKCGVHQYGIRLFDILKKSKNVEYIYLELDTYKEYQIIIEHEEYDMILYNYHPHHRVMGWLNEQNIQRKTKNIGLQHDLQENNIFDITLRLDVTLEERINRYNIPRPIFEDIDKLLEDYEPSSEKIKQFISYAEEKVPIFGSFGFGFNRKGFDKIVKLINDSYEKAIIKIVMPHAETEPSDPDVIPKCFNNITKNGITLMITDIFLSENDILYFLRSNTMNIFMYETHPSAGLSSVIDYALSVKIPLAINDASWFRHIYSDEINVFKTPIQEIVNVSEDYCKQYLDKFSNANLIDKIDTLILENITFNSKQ